MSGPTEQPMLLQPAPENRLRRIWQRLPGPVRWVAVFALYFFAAAGVYGVLDGGARLSENVLFPRQIDPAWATQVDLPLGQGDSWVGNVTSDGDRIYFSARQTIRGFWGLLAVWSSDDGGLTWSHPNVVSRHPIPDTARHALAVGPHGTLWTAFVQQGPAVATQRLWVRTSADHGNTWSDAIAVSPPRIGLIGVPVFLLTPDVRLVAFTDGETGDVLVRRLSAEGEPLGVPVTIGTTARQLYDDADFLDARITLSSAEGRVVAVWVEGAETLRAASSSDGGEFWMPATGLDQRLYSGRPRLASNGSEVILAASDPNRSARYPRHPFIRIWRSSDGGQIFDRGPDVTDVAYVGSVDLLWSDGFWHLTYDACPGFIGCATPERVWYTASTDGQLWPEPIVISPAGPLRALGLAASPYGLVAVWGDGSGSHDWSFHLAQRER